jgi:AcrR family transcriptional regulator
MTQTKTPSRRINDPEQTRADILRAAQAEFASHGFAGTRIDRIAAKTRRSKRMIYYYFSSKRKLYTAVLDQAYRSIREAENDLDLETDDPRTAIKRLVEFCFDYHFDHPNYVKMIMGENLNDARYLADSSIVSDLHRPIIGRIEHILRRGYERDLFRQTVSPVELHLTLSGLCFFNVSNRATFSFIFDHDMASAASRRERKRQIFLTLMGRLDARLDDFASAFTERTAAGGGPPSRRRGGG